MLRGKRLRDPGLPRWPPVYVTRHGVVTVTSRHATVPRYRLVRASLTVLTLAGVAAAVVLGFSLAGKTDRTFNGVQRCRLTADRFLIDHGGELLRRLPWPVVEHQLWAGPRLSGAAWAGLGAGWLALTAVMQAVNRPLLSGGLFARRTTVKFTRAGVVLYRLRFVPRRFRWDRVGGAVQFKVDPHPRLQAANDAGLAADVRGVYRDSGRVVMVYGARAVPIVVIVGAEAAGQFAVCCAAAAQLAREYKPAAARPAGGGGQPRARLE